jgi:hypothetical protein
VALREHGDPHRRDDDHGDREVAAALEVHRQPQVDRSDGPRHVRAGGRVAGAEVDDPVHVGRPIPAIAASRTAMTSHGRHQWVGLYI